MPERIQRLRTKGWRMPPNSVYVGRPTEWGNQFIVGGWFMIGDFDPYARFRMIWCQCFIPNRPGFTLIKNAAMAVDFYRRYLKTDAVLVEKIKHELCGKNLSCWCKLTDPCHADVLLEIANDSH